MNIYDEFQFIIIQFNSTPDWSVVIKNILTYLIFFNRYLLNRKCIKYFFEQQSIDLNLLKTTNFVMIEFFNSKLITFTFSLIFHLLFI